MTNDEFSPPVTIVAALPRRVIFIARAGPFLAFAVLALINVVAWTQHKPLAPVWWVAETSVLVVPMFFMRTTIAEVVIDPDGITAKPVLGGRIAMPWSAIDSVTPLKVKGSPSARRLVRMESSRLGKAVVISDRLGQFDNAVTSIAANTSQADVKGPTGWKRWAYGIVEAWGWDAISSP